jgi:hypothetical protein
VVDFSAKGNDPILRAHDDCGGCVSESDVHGVAGAVFEAVVDATPPQTPGAALDRGAEQSRNVGRLAADRRAAPGAGARVKEERRGDCCACCDSGRDDF